jgi:hypothetical protein
MKQHENKGRTFLEFVRLFTQADTVSRANIMEQMNMKQSAFYKYLAECQKIFTITYQGSIANNAYYSLDKNSLKKYFNL